MRGLKHRTKFVFLLTILVSISMSCSSVLQVKPNEPYMGSYPDQFSQIASNNPFLAKEIGKLPEMQDGISAEKMREKYLLKAQGGIDEEIMTRVLRYYRRYPGDFTFSAKRIVNTVTLNDPRWGDDDAILDRLNKFIDMTCYAFIFEYKHCTDPKLNNTLSVDSPGCSFTTTT